MNKFQKRYNWLAKHLPIFIAELGILESSVDWLIVSHGDKADSLEQRFADNGIKFEYGLCIYLLTYLSPYTKMVRNTKDEWVAPIDWILGNKDLFLHILEKIDTEN